MAHLLIRDRDLGTLGAIPVSVYINGEYYQEAYLRERYDARYFKEHYGAAEDDLILISDSELDYGSAADYEAYLAMMSYIERHDCSDPAVWAEVERQIDVQSLLDFLAANFYCNNIDWRYYKNYKVWRTRSVGGDGALDGRWRWLAYDMDAVGWANRWTGGDLASIDPFHASLPWLDHRPNDLTYLEIPMLRSLLKNSEFKTRFIQTYLDLMNVNYSPASAAPLLAEYGLTGHPLWLPFLKERPPYAVKNLIDAMKPEAETCSLTLRISDPKGGSVRLNTVQPDLSGGSWTGTYLTGVPLTLCAEAAEGWRFVRWEGSEYSAEPTVTLTPSGDIQMAAVFERIG